MIPVKTWLSWGLMVLCFQTSLPAIISRTAAVFLATVLLSHCGDREPGSPSSAGTPTSNESTGALLDSSLLSLPDNLDSKPASVTRIVLCAADSANPFQRAQASLLSGLVRARPGTTLEVLDARGDAAAQAGQLRDALSSKPAALFVLPVSANIATTALAVSRGDDALIIGLDENLKAPACDSVVCCRQADLGRLAGELVIEALRRKASDEGRTEVSGRVVQLRGSESDAWSDARAAGFAAALTGAPGIVLVHDAPGEWRREAAMERMKEALRLQHEFDVVFAHNDLMAQAAGLATTDAGLRDRVLIVGIDALPGPEGGLEMLERSEIDASVHQPLLVDFAWKVMVRKLDQPDFIPQARYELPGMAVTPRNLDEVLRHGFGTEPSL